VVIFYFVISIALGLALDWALYSRIVLSLGMPYFYGGGDGYTKFLYPRIIFTVTAIAVMFFAKADEGDNIVLFLCAAAVFLFSPCRAAYRYLMGE
jgi:hypothetical protein